ncbi:MAG: hypothetical protein AAFN27_05050 [Pseudomonadota bacterium]
MTPEEVFAQLRDVHLPDVQSATVTGLDMRPLVFFAASVLLIGAIRYWVQRRRRSRQLDAVAPGLPPAAQRDEIARVLRKALPRKAAQPAPRAFFAPPSQLTAQDASEMKTWARRRLR